MLNIGTWFGRKPEEVGCVANIYLERTRQAQQDLLLVLEYLAERTEEALAVEPTDDDIRQAALLCATPFRSLEEAQRGEIWALMDRLSGMIAPATVEGLRATRHGHSGLAGWPTLLIGVMLTFLLALVLQMYTLFGSQTLDRLDQLNAEAHEVYQKINTFEEHLEDFFRLRAVPADRPNRGPAVEDQALLPKAIGETAADPTPSQLGSEDSTREYKHLRDRLDSINDAKAEVFQNLYRWNAAWAWPLAVWVHGREPGEHWGYDCRPKNEEPCQSWLARLSRARGVVSNNGADPAATSSPEGSGGRTEIAVAWEAAPFGYIQIRYGSEAFARSNLETLRGLFLPVLYGMLGAWVWLLRERYRQVRLRKLRPPVWGEYLQRVLLGAVFGAALGYLNLPSFLPAAIANISLIGLAFVIGYNVEVMFWLFDQMFKAMRDKRAEEEQERVRQRGLVGEIVARPPASPA